jgi:hypothetical protein
MTKRRLLVIGAVVVALAIFAKFTLFGSPFNQESALTTARWQLEQASQERQFDLSKFSAPDEITGRNDRNGYAFHWYFSGKDGGSKLSVIVAVSPYDVDFTGTPFVLDCRPGRDSETKKAGFTYLCKSPN